MAEARELSPADRLHDGASGQEADVHGRRVRSVARMARLRGSRVGARSQHPHHRQLQDWNRALNRLYREYPELHASEHTGKDFAGSKSTIATKACSRFCGSACRARAARTCIVAFNCTPVPRDNYVLGVPRRRALSQDSRQRRRRRSAVPATRRRRRPKRRPSGWRDFPARIRVTLPPLAMVVWAQRLRSAAGRRLPRSLRRRFAFRYFSLTAAMRHHCRR